MSHSSGLAACLSERRDDIVARFVGEVERMDPSPPGVAPSLLVDHLPGFLDELVLELDRLEGVRTTQDTVDTRPTAQRHGGQRWARGHDLEALIREYGILRHCIVAAAKEAGLRPSLDEFDVLAKCLSVGVSEAATKYVHYRDEQLDAQKDSLAFLAEAGQGLSSSLDYRSTLRRLTALLVPRLGDCCIVHLDDIGDADLSVAHVDPAKARLLREIHRRFPLPRDCRHGYPVLLRTGEPRLVREVDRQQLEALAQSPEHLSLLKQLDTCSWLIVPLRIQGNTVGGLLLMYSDSRRRYSQQELVLAAELARRAAVAIDNARLYELSQRERSRVEAATRAKDEFVAMISHELRTPLNAMLGWIRLMRRGALNESKREHALEVVERNAHAQSQLVADLLDISRVITGQMRLNPSPIDLASIAEMAIEGVRPALDAKRITLATDLAATGSIMRGDSDRLQQVVWNLLANAVKFTPRGGQVSVRLRRLEADLELVVQDTGEGIDESFLPYVFDSFRQSDTSTSRPHGGLGIGLSIAKHIVELHGGTIAARSSGVGEGAAFEVRFPISPPLSTTPVLSRIPAAKTPAPIAWPGGLDGIRVLVVDDDPDARELVAYVLESCAMEVRVAGSATDALKELASYSPHVVVSDIGMAGDDGYSLIRSIRALAATDKTSVPALALTAFARNEDRTRALVEGFNLHLAKPVEPAELVRAVAELAGRSGGLERG